MLKSLTRIGGVNWAAKSQNTKSVLHKGSSAQLVRLRNGSRREIPGTSGIGICVTKGDFPTPPGSPIFFSNISPIFSSISSHMSFHRLFSPVFSRICSHDFSVFFSRIFVNCYRQCFAILLANMFPICSQICSHIV